jgi:hypothetical protein
MVDKKIIVHGMNLYQILVDDSLTIVLVPDALPLATIPPKPLAIAKPQSYERAYCSSMQANTSISVGASLSQGCSTEGAGHQGVGQHQAAST